MMEHNQLPHSTFSEQYGRLVSLSLPCPDVSLASFLYQAQGQPRFYWESNQDHVAFAGFGMAVEINEWGPERFERIQRHARDLFADSYIDDAGEPLAGPRLFGGFAFRDDFVPDNAWADFTPAHFVLPHYQLVSVGGAKWLTLNAQIPHDEAIDAILPDLRAALLARAQVLRATTTVPFYQPQPVMDVTYPLSYKDWGIMLESAICRMQAGELNKVVLSRVAEVRLAERIQLDAVLRYLADHYAECYRFLFEPRAHRAFYGATPELITSVAGRQVRTMGMAGSIRRGTTADEDARLGQELLESSKDRYEHQIVVDIIRRRLEPLTRSLEIRPTQLYRLSNIQHLYTPISGQLVEARGVLPVLAQLHPTPALGGDPHTVALEAISQYEGVTRGWYAAPVGWIDRNLDGQFAVAIRSAVAQERRVWLYAGAGIVRDSEPDKEWDETAIKFRPMLNALGITEAVGVRHGQS